MKNPTVKGFEGTPENFAKILYEGWWTGSNDWEEGRMGWKRAFLIVMICTILSNVVLGIVKKKFWNNSQEENTAETQTKLVE